MQKVDILAFGAHPDDVELACAGTLIKAINQGKLVAIADLSRGELGTRGTADDRDQEAANAAKVLGVTERINLDLPDGFFSEDRDSMIAMIRAIRKFQPELVLINAPRDRHPDHGRGGEFAARACFLSGLVKIDTGQAVWRPQNVMHYVQDYYLEPDVVVDISDEFEDKMEAIRQFKSQFYDPDSTEPETPISSKGFMDHIVGRAKQFGRLIGVDYGEGFIKTRPVGVEDLTLLK